MAQQPEQKGHGRLTARVDIIPNSAGVEVTVVSDDVGVRGPTVTDARERPFVSGLFRLAESRL